MTLKEKFDNVEIMFENQIGKIKYDELCEASNQCEKVAEDFAIGFAEWILRKQLKILSQGEYWDVFFEKRITVKELLKIYKKEKIYKL